MSKTDYEKLEKSAPKDWQEVKLGEVVNLGSSKRIFYKEYKKVGIPFYRSKEIIEKFNKKPISTKLHITEKKFLEIKEKFGVPVLGDILLTSVGSLGVPYIVQKNEKFYFKDGNLIWFKNFTNNLFSKFLYYWIISSLGKKFLQGVAIGSTQPALTIVGLNQLFLLLPPLPEQKAIAEVLSSLDDKIDLLQKQNQTLENIAQTLFRKYFIQDKKKDWEKVSLGNSKLSKILGSGINEFIEEKTYLATADIQEEKIINSNKKITYKKRPSRANMQPVEFSIWFARKGGVRKIIMFDKFSKNIESTILSTGFSGLKTTKESHYYIWCFVFNYRFQKIKDNLISGSVQPDISNDGIKNIKILMPKPKLLNNFNHQVEPLFAKIQTNQTQIQTLENLRNSLLPKLISGKVRVNF